jgi:hypothetical protein
MYWNFYIFINCVGLCVIKCETCFASILVVINFIIAIIIFLVTFIIIILLIQTEILNYFALNSVHCFVYF